MSADAQSGSGELPGAKPTPTPKGRRPVAKPAAPTAPAPVATPTLSFNQSYKGRLDPRASDKAPNGSIFEEHILNAKSEELLSFQLQSDNPALTVQLFDKDKTEIPVAKDLTPGSFKINTPSGGLPADGEFRVRVSCAAPGKSTPYTLTANRLGLLQGVYNERFEQIIFNFRENDQASVDETLAKLEELAAADSSKSGAFEFLGIIYFSNRKDAAKAEQAMERAIKTNGAAVVKITFDSQWRRMAKLRSGNTDWEDPRTGWLRIRPGQVTLTDPSNRALATVNGPQIKELAKVVTNTNNLVVVTTDGARRPFVFLPGSKEFSDADLVIKLIRNYVMGKGKQGSGVRGQGSG
jgi:hypothetical protein